MKVKRTQLTAVDGENGRLYFGRPRVSGTYSRRVSNMATWDSHTLKIADNFDPVAMIPWPERDDLAPTHRSPTSLT
jgi:hypothetical protein